jgi:hypothetical protein
MGHDVYPQFGALAEKMRVGDGTQPARRAVPATP